MQSFKKSIALIILIHLVFINVTSSFEHRKSAAYQRSPNLLLSSNNLYDKQQAALLTNANAAANTLNGMHGLNANANRQQMLRAQQQPNLNQFNQMGFPFAFGMNNFNNPMMSYATFGMDGARGAGSGGGFNLQKMLSGQENGGRRREDTTISSTLQRQRKNGKSNRKQKIKPIDKTAEAAASTTLRTPTATSALASTVTTPSLSSTPATQKPRKEQRRRTTTLAP